MSKKGNGGYSLVEILLAIVLLGVIMVPTCTSLVMSIKINDRTDEMMQAQLAVSSAVETLMAEGIYLEGGTETFDASRFPNVRIDVTHAGNYFSVSVQSTIVESVEIETNIREVPPPPTEPETEPGTEQGGDD